MIADLRTVSVTAYQKEVRAAKRRDLVWRISVDLVAKELTASLGNDEDVVIPLSVCPSGLCQVGADAKPNFEKPDVRDHGQTIGLGGYEATVASTSLTRQSAARWFESSMELK